MARPSWPSGCASSLDFSERRLEPRSTVRTVRIFSNRPRPAPVRIHPLLLGLVQIGRAIIGACWVSVSPRTSFRACFNYQLSFPRRGISDLIHSLHIHAIDRVIQRIPPPSWILSCRTSRFLSSSGRKRIHSKHGRVLPPARGDRESYDPFKVNVETRARHNSKDWQWHFTVWPSPGLASSLCVTRCTSNAIYGVETRDCGGGNSVVQDGCLIRRFFRYTDNNVFGNIAVPSHVQEPKCD